MLFNKDLNLGEVFIRLTKEQSEKFYEQYNKIDKLKKENCQCVLYFESYWTNKDGNRKVEPFIIKPYHIFED